MKALDTVRTYHLNAKPSLTEPEIHQEVKKHVEATEILIWETDISLRAINACKIHDYNGRKAIQIGILTREDFKPLATIGDLCKWTKEELLELQNCGVKTITEFEGLLSKYGLNLEPSIPE